MLYGYNCVNPFGLLTPFHYVKLCLVYILDRLIIYFYYVDLIKKLLTFTLKLRIRCVITLPINMHAAAEGRLLNLLISTLHEYLQVHKSYTIYFIFICLNAYIYLNHKKQP